MAATARAGQRVAQDHPIGGEEPARMRLKTKAAAAAPAAPAPTPPRYELRTSGPVSDLVCTICARVIAYAVPTGRAGDEASFYLEMHAPSCLRVRS
jgi:hypothetical protein